MQAIGRQPQRVLSDELPDECLKWITPRNQGFGSGFAREYQQAWSRGSGLGSIVGAGNAPGRPALPAAPRASAASPSGLRVGRSVSHSKLGEGVVVTLEEGAGDDARAGQLRAPRHEVAGAFVAMRTPVD